MLSEGGGQGIERWEGVIIIWLSNGRELLSFGLDLKVLEPSTKAMWKQEPIFLALRENVYIWGQSRSILADLRKYDLYFDSDFYDRAFGKKGSE